MARKASVEHQSIDSYLAAIRYLTEHKIPFSDRTSIGGALWVFIPDPDSAVIADLKAATGVRFNYAKEGGSASHNKPAWYYRPYRKRDDTRKGQPIKAERGSAEPEPPAHEDFELKQPAASVPGGPEEDSLWPWLAVDENRVRNAQKIPEDSVRVNRALGSASIDGSPDRKTGEVVSYTVTLVRCTCQDFNMNLKCKKPCKHIIRLGMELGVINENGLTPAQQRAADIAELREKVARAAGYYYIFRSPICEDNMYDRMKARLARLEAQ